MNKLLFVLLVTATAGSAHGQAVAQEALSCRTPLAGWRPLPKVTPHMGLWSKVKLNGAGVIHWNGKRINSDELSVLLKKAASEEPQPFIIFQPEHHASCKAIREIRAEMERSLHCSKGYCGEGTGWDAVL